jgi:hypothetical protein
MDKGNFGVNALVMGEEENEGTFFVYKLSLIRQTETHVSV